MRLSYCRFDEVLFIADTCQAATLSDPLRSSGIVSLASSVRGENSYAQGGDRGEGGMERRVLFGKREGTGARGRLYVILYLLSLI